MKNGLYVKENDREKVRARGVNFHTHQTPSTDALIGSGNGRSIPTPTTPFSPGCFGAFWRSLMWPIWPWLLGTVSFVGAKGTGPTGGAEASMWGEADEVLRG